MMKLQLVFLGVMIAYWILVGLVLVSIVNAWPWLAGSPWLFAVFAPFFVAGMAIRVIMRRKLAAGRLPKS